MKHNKKGHQILGLVKKDGLVKNYLAWIANLGVVPLFLFAAFLFEPADFFLAALLLFVTQVLETILILLSKTQLYVHLKNKTFFLPFLGQSVKIILVFFGLCTMTITYAEESKIQKTFETELIMTKGEIKILKLTNFDKFNISNKELIKYKYNPAKKELTLRAQSLGHGVIEVFNHQTLIEKYEVMVVGKVLDLKLTSLSKMMNTLHLNTTNEGGHLLIEGTLNSMIDFKSFSQIYKKYKDVIVTRVELSKELRKLLLGKIYNELFSNNYESVQCDFNQSELLCHLNENEILPENFKKYLEENYQVTFLSVRKPENQNYKVKLKLIQLEQLNGEEIRFGLEQLNASLDEIVKIPTYKIIERNSVLLKNNSIDLNTLAEPQFVTDLNHFVEFSVGSDIAFKNYDNDKKTTSTDWHFAGLKIKVKLEKLADRFKITYENELSKPSDDSSNISGSKGSSALYLSLNKGIKIFDITLKTSQKAVDSFPLISKIPILGELFKSKSHSDNYKTISAIIEVSENE
jgi:hypothetical protein